MKVALIHYWLLSMRGGEKVLEALCELYPKADIYTHVYDPNGISDVIRAHKVQTTFIQRLPAAGKLYKKYLPLMPMALEELDLPELRPRHFLRSGPRERSDHTARCPSCMLLPHPDALHLGPVPHVPRKRRADDAFVDVRHLAGAAGVGCVDGSARRSLRCKFTVRGEANYEILSSRSNSNSSSGVGRKVFSSGSAWQNTYLSPVSLSDTSVGIWLLKPSCEMGNGSWLPGLARKPRVSGSLQVRALISSFLTGKQTINCNRLCRAVERWFFRARKTLELSP